MSGNRTWSSNRIKRRRMALARATIRARTGAKVSARIGAELEAVMGREVMIREGARWEVGAGAGKGRDTRVDVVVRTGQEAGTRVS